MTAYRTTPTHGPRRTPWVDIDWRGWLAIALIAPGVLARITRHDRARTTGPGRSTT